MALTSSRHQRRIHHQVHSSVNTIRQRLPMVDTRSIVAANVHLYSAVRRLVHHRGIVLVAGSRPGVTSITTLCSKKVVHQAHIDNLVNSQRIFKNLSLTHSAENLPQCCHWKSYHTLNASLHYLVKHRMLYTDRSVCDELSVRGTHRRVNSHAAVQ